jgi:hypothetical protein
MNSWFPPHTRCHPDLTHHSCALPHPDPPTSANARASDERYRRSVIFAAVVRADCQQNQEAGGGPRSARAMRSACPPSHGRRPRNRGRAQLPLYRHRDLLAKIHMLAIEPRPPASTPTRRSPEPNCSPTSSLRRRSAPQPGPAPRTSTLRSPQQAGLTRLRARRHADTNALQQQTPGSNPRSSTPQAEPATRRATKTAASLLWG